MKYTIEGFQQKELIKNDLNTEDALVLRFFKNLYASASMEFIGEGKTKYMWVSYTYIQKQIPIIGNKRKLMRLIKKYEEKGLIKRVLKHERNGIKGNFAYISPTLQLDKLEEYDLMSEKHKGYVKNDTSLMQNGHNKDTSLYDTSLYDNKTIAEQDKSSTTERKNNHSTNKQNNEFFEELWKLYPRKKGKGKVSQTQKNKIAKISKEEFERAIKRFKKEMKGKDNKFIMYGSTFFNSGYLDYLDENYEETTKKTYDTAASEGYLMI